MRWTFFALVCASHFIFAVPALAQRRSCWLAYEGYVPLKSPKGPEIAGRSCDKWMQGYEFDPSEALQSGEKVFQKLYTANGDFGFVDESYLVLSNRAIPAKENTNIYRKVRLSNSYEFVRSESARSKIDKEREERLKGIPAYSAPLEIPLRVRDKKTFQLAALRFVFKETKDFLLVGRDMTFGEAGDNTADKVIDGWIKKDRAIAWNTRQAAEWNYENAQSRLLPAMLFSSYSKYESGNEFLDTETTVQDIVTFAKERKQLEDKLAPLRSDGETLKLVAERSNLIERHESGQKIRQLEAEIKRRDAVRAAELNSLLEQYYHKWHVTAKERIVFQFGQLSFERMKPNSSRTRMPLLKSSNNQTLEPLIPEELAGYSAYRVGGNAELQGSISQEVLETYQLRMKKSQDSLKSLDVQLVIDATSTMRSYMTTAIATLARIAMELDSRDTSIRFAITFYRDNSWHKANMNTGGPEWVEVFDYVDLPLQSMEDQSVKRLVVELIESLENENRNSEVTQDRTKAKFSQLLQKSDNAFFRTLYKAYGAEASSGGGGKESVFGGLQAAIKQTNNYRSNAMNLIIVIGDWGDNGDSGLSEAQIVSLIAPPEHPLTGLAVIDVGYGSDLVANPIGESLENIGLALNKNLNGEISKGDARYTEIAQIKRERNPSKVAEAISKQVAGMREQARRSIREIETFKTQGFADAAAEATSFTRALLKRDNADVEALSKIDGLEIFRESIVPYKSAAGESCIRANVLVTSGELARLIEALGPIAREPVIREFAVDGNSTKEVLRQAIQILVGQQSKAKSDGTWKVEEQAMSFAAALSTITDIPARSSLMNLPVLAQESDERDNEKLDADAELERKRMLKEIQAQWDELFEQKSDVKAEERRKRLLQDEIERLTIVYFRLLDVQQNRFQEYKWTDGKNQDGFSARVLEATPVNPFGGLSIDTIDRHFQFDVDGDTYHWLDLETEYP